MNILWQRLDAPGHDACRLIETQQGATLDGAAVFLHGGVPACLGYRVECDARWRTLTGSVRGWIGARTVDLRIRRRSAGDWTFNDNPVPGLDELLDLDLGFTPSTNLFQIRRSALAAGETADMPAAWLDADSATLERLEQRYQRLSSSEYAYQAPRFGYSATLEVDVSGFVTRYPGLWVAQEK